jgi:hypothetical protein
MYHTGDMLNTLLSKLLPLDREFELINPAGSVFQLSLPSHSEGQHELRGIVTLMPSSEPTLYRMVTVSSTPFWLQGVRPLIRRLYPDAMPVFFKQAEVKNALLSLEKSLGAGYRVRIAEATMKRTRHDAATTPHRLDTDRLWTELPIIGAFDQALEQGQWFTSLHYRVQRESGDQRPHRDVALGSIYKYGEISYDYFHQEITTHLVSVLERHAAQRLALLRGRGIRDRGYTPALPIQVSYDHDVFDDVAEVRRFGKVIARYPNSTRAVFHGNPYYHASIADFIDGSSFDVWILSSTKVLIIPQAKSSEQAFERLISHVFHEFMEGAISEYNS